METKVNYTVVGAFVIILLSAIILAIIWLSSGLSTEKYSYYKVYMKEAVSGLSLDSPVEYNGVNVGTVSTIRIDHKNPRIVILLLKIKSSTPVTMGTRAKLDIRSISGVSYILLEDKGTDMRPLKRISGQTFPVINTTPSIFVRLDTVLTELSTSFHQLSSSVQSLLNPENLRSIKLTLKNISKFTTTLAVNTPELENILHDTSQAARVIKSKTLPSADQAISNINNLTGNLSEVSEELKQNPSVIIRGRAQPELGPGE